MDKYQSRGRDTALYAVLGITATWLGAWLPCAILSEAVGVSFPYELLLLLAGFSVPLWFALQATESFWRRLLVKLVPLLLAALFCALYLDQTAEGVRGVLRKLAAQANDYMGWNITIPGAASTEGMEILLAWLLPTTLLLTVSVAAADGIAPLAWIAASVFAPTIAVSLNIFPPVWMLIAYVALALYFVVAQNSFVLPVRAGNRLRVGAALTLAVITVSAGVIISESFYDENIRYLEIREELRDKLWEKMPALFNTRNVTRSQRSGMSGGSLPLNGYVTDSGDLRLRVTYPSGMSTIYLRGEAYGEYDGTAWTLENRHIFQVEDIDRRGGGVVDIANMTALYGKSFIDYGPMMKAVRFPVKSSNLVVEVFDENERYLFVPYDTYAVVGEESGMVSISHNAEGCYIISGGNTSRYICSFLYNDWNVPSYLAYGEKLTGSVAAPVGNPQLAEVISRYDSFAYENYLEIPSRCSSVKGMISLSENATLYDAVTAVQSFLRGYRYTTSPGPTPEDKDFITYFLKEKKAGFCVHFASAGVMLFRSLGIPARYAEGYVIQPGDMKNAKPAGSTSMEIRDAGSNRSETISVETLDVYDRSAHAWVEIYIAGYGWFPVEVTYSGVPMEETLSYLSKLQVVGTQPTPTPDKTPTPAPTGEPTKAPSGAVTPKATATPRPAKTPTPVVTRTPTPTPDVTETPKKSSGDGGPWKTVLLTGGILLIIGSLLCMRRAYARSRRRSRILGTEPRRAVTAVCREIGYLFRLNGVTLRPGESESSYTERVSEVLGNVEALRWIYDLGNRANFGAERITREDRRRALTLYRKIRTRTLRGKSFATRFAWVFLRGI
jgi:transglutaminase-like putative cysteine protease